ncbi:cytochrome P450 [Schizopora paradoxa]|uniref:Cytochrome P450 n=1 Tax=Schizopora paradoxa TaxID=27342 RepID=A0A0H2RW97_9AGAM|nr:cytochrome P450 [Schizopora paradoxa]
MSLQIVLACLITCISYISWRVLRPLVVKTPLSILPGPPRQSLFSGNFSQIFNRNGWKFHLDLVKKYGTTIRIHHFLGDERLYTIDPLALHHIFVKHQYTYEETPMFLTMMQLQFGTGLLSTLGEHCDHHKKQRKMLNPVFSLKHMRGLLPIFYPVSHQLRDVLVRKVKNGEEEINVMAWMSRAALEYIGQGGFGYTFDALNENSRSEYSEAVKMLVPLGSTMFAVRNFLPLAKLIGTPKIWRKIVEWTPVQRVQQARSIIDLMHETSLEIYSMKLKALEQGDEAVVEQIGNGNDIMSILLRANAEASEEDRLPDHEILGQISTFVFAGHDTTTSALSRTLHQLVLHPDVQEKLRQEVTEARKDGDIGYDVLMGLPFLDAVCRETLRLFPPVPTVQRVTRQDITLPLLFPVKSADGKTEIKEIPLKKNTGVVVSLMNVNRCKAIWGEDAEQWKPERWLKPLPETVASAHLPGVYASMMTFIGGGRACIGFKFAEMELKLALSILLETFVFSPGSKEIDWMMAGLQSPVIKGSDDITPQLPLKLSLVKH